jgi:hypothetical protein
MRTAQVKLLVREVLATLPKPYSEHVIDDVFGAVERNRGGGSVMTANATAWAKPS